MKDKDRISFPMDYDTYASTYAWARKAVPWVVAPLVRCCEALAAGASILEIGCGSGNYIGALADARPDLAHFGFDLSESMLTEARRKCLSVVFRHGDASRQFPFPDRTFAFAFAVDVIHHIDDVARFFQEAHRVLARGGRLAVVTDSENTFRQRSLTKFFPEILPIELARYPTVLSLHAAAGQAGFQLVSEAQVFGRVALDQDFLTHLEAKCSSAMRLMDPTAHAAGMARVRAAAQEGQQWVSCYDLLEYVPV